MFFPVIDWFLARMLIDMHRRLMASLGRALSFGAGAAIVLGLSAQIVKLEVNQLREAAGDQELGTLAQLNFGFPTWWVPETLSGYLAAVAILLTGVLVDRLLQH